MSWPLHREELGLPDYELLESDSEPRKSSFLYALNVSAAKIESSR